MRLRYGYNTNGFANHALPDIITILSALSYDGIALTLDHAHCYPHIPDTIGLERLHAQLRTHELAVVIETGARFLLDPWQKHEPTLVSREGRDRRIQFLKQAIDIAAFLDAEAVAFFSGVRRADVSPQEAEQFFLAGCEAVLRYASEKHVIMALEPEPGMFVESMAQFERYDRLLDHPNLKLTLDVGHLFCTEQAGTEAEIIEQFGQKIVNIHIEDIKERTHHHLPFQEGTIDFEPILKAIKKIGYRGLVNVELSRDSHRAPDMARQSIQFLTSVEQSIERGNAT